MYTAGMPPSMVASCSFTTERVLGTSSTYIHLPSGVLSMRMTTCIWMKSKMPQSSTCGLYKNTLVSGVSLFAQTVQTAVLPSHTHWSMLSMFAATDIDATLMIAAIQ